VSSHPPHPVHLGRCAAPGQVPTVRIGLYWPTGQAVGVGVGMSLDPRHPLPGPTNQLRMSFAPLQPQGEGGIDWGSLLVDPSARRSMSLALEGGE